MTRPTLVVMAAGMGSRYGGLKQIDPVGPGGESIMEYSIYDALEVGFAKVVFVIKKDMEESFRTRIGKKIEKVTGATYVFQDINDLPAGLKAPAGREKPWGTAHAVFCCRNAVNTPFAVINADDFYGRTSFKMLCDYLSGTQNNREIYNFCMIGFRLENTLTEHGHVARGICRINPGNYLGEIVERTKIKRCGGSIRYTEDDNEWIEIPKDSIVSMNMWGFTPGLFKEIEAGFPGFFANNRKNIVSAEYFLPLVIDTLLAEKKAAVKVLISGEQWYGMTYKKDRPLVKQAVDRLVRENTYPENLWEVRK